MEEQGIQRRNIGVSSLLCWLNYLLTHFSFTDESMYEHPLIAQSNVLIYTEASIPTMTAGQDT